MVRKLFLAVGIAALSFTATACNTVRGAAEDVESVANEADEAV